MGQVNRKHERRERSTNTSRSSHSYRDRYRNRNKYKRDKERDRNLSHSFSWPEGGACDGVDVNQATEEQLMTVSGVSRELARNIVHHRNTIGRYRKIDDLALVSGMGANKLNEIRTEICIGRRKADNDSTTQSLDSAWSTESTKSPLDINSTSVFQLQCVPGLDQELAANIVDYRRKKGYFKRLDDLIKVKGIDIIRLGAIKRYLTVNDYDYEKNNQILNELKMLKNGMNGHVKTNGMCSNPLLTPGHRKSSSMPSKYIYSLTNGHNLSPVDDIFDLLSAYSRRPILEECFRYERDGESAIRIATWNLEQLTVEKAMNPGFKEVVCRTILENKISILCIQEVMTEDVLQIICKELNVPCLKRVKEWKDNHKQWRYLFKTTKYETESNFGYIYEDDYRNDIQVVEMSDMKYYPAEDNCVTSTEDTSVKSITFDTSQGPNFNRDITEFKINDEYFGFLNLHLTESNSEYRTTLICELIDKLSNIYDNLIVLGTFYTTKNLEELSSCYKSVINPQINTSAETSVFNKKCGILIPNSKNVYTNHSGIIRIGLHHLAIPKGWSWGGPASSHCPIWAEFFT